MRMKIRPKRTHQNQNTIKKFNVEVLQDITRVQKLQQKLQGQLPQQFPISVDEHWNQLKNAIITSCKEAIGFKIKKRQDWFDENDKQLQEIMGQKRKAFSAVQNDQQSAAKRKRYQECKAEVQKVIRNLKNQWWKEKACEIQQLADANETRDIFNAIKAIFGPSTYGQAPLKSKDGSTFLKSNADISARWKEHFQDLLNQTIPFDRNVINNIPTQPIDDSLSKLPSLENVRGAISTLKSNKASGTDGIPAEAYKFGGSLLEHQLHQLIIKIWMNEETPPDFRDAAIVTIYKKKGDRSDCGNYRGISLLTTAGKILALIMNNRLEPLVEKILPETHAGFRTTRGTTDMIFTLRQLQEKCREQLKPLYIAFIDLTKAFDSVSRELLWKVLFICGCPAKYIRILRLLHDDMLFTVRINDSNCEPFQVKFGVKQGCVIAPTLFTISIAIIMYIIKNDLPPGI